MKQTCEYTFSNLNKTGSGFDAVTGLQYSSPNWNASWTLLPGNLMKTESVSPYKTWAPNHLPLCYFPHLLARSIAFISMQRPHSTIASATSGIVDHQKNEANVWPYVTLATYFKANCLASICLNAAGLQFWTCFLYSLAAFFNIALVESILSSTCGRTPFKMDLATRIL